MPQSDKTVIAGDIGGTSARLACYRGQVGAYTVVAEQTYPSSAYPSLSAILRDFTTQQAITTIDRTCLGVAGTVRNGEVHAPNLPWGIAAKTIASDLNLPIVTLINDLAANVHGIAMLDHRDIQTLNPGTPERNGTIAVISAGTGLGEAIAYWDGANYRPLPTEGGHADFAPRTRLEAELLFALQAEYGRVSYERVISGPGLRRVYGFLRDRNQQRETATVAEMLTEHDPSAIIAQAALTGACPLCSAALELFISCYGAEAGNLALRSLAFGGVYIGGGIAPKIIAKLTEATFMAAFTDKGRLSQLMGSIPVHVIMNERTALLGAARCAFLLPA